MVIFFFPYLTIFLALPFCLTMEMPRREAV